MKCLKIKKGQMEGMEAFFFCTTAGLEQNECEDWWLRVRWYTVHNKSAVHNNVVPNDNCELARDIIIFIYNAFKNTLQNLCENGKFRWECLKRRNRVLTEGWLRNWIRKKIIMCALRPILFWWLRREGWYATYMLVSSGKFYLLQVYGLRTWKYRFVNGCVDVK